MTGDGRQTGVAPKGGVIGAGQSADAAAQPALAAALTPAYAIALRIVVWDERPWTDLPARLAKQSTLRLVNEVPDAHHADGLLIIRRWPTPIVLKRLAREVAAAQMPVLLCTAATSELCADVLRLGVTDIVRDDMHLAEVEARLALRCSAARGMDGMQLAAGPLLLDRMQRLAWLHGRILRLTALQFDVLAALMKGAKMQEAGQVISTEALRHAVWHNTADPGTNRLAVHIHHIRRALQDAGGAVGVAAEGGGYRLIL